ncbi:hypothetical protein VW29_14320 [Devosia limi DSM 17137]|uniref:DUF1684 domain-containing protein n=1 Tax=Devosia limi DSM 17137 TaxID=1121477 RepID=A0A0F5LKN8_9HYPH|nr:DUF1684 domain-containing protein [Devosia limi]KKB82749.1 hypothetical protein VW29_14320 [Devosia limi DSM 17137]SHF46114.1 hypothetical protein SAMN02745223_02667 [Devosia limi DSM 17137]
MSDYQAEIATWRAARLKTLFGDEGWLNLIGREWLAPGSATIGSAEDNDLIMERGPAHIGTVTLVEDGTVTLVSADSLTTLEFAPSSLSQRQVLGSVLVEIHQFNGRPSIRLRDLDSNPGATFPGIETFPVDPAWRVTGQWVSLDTPQAIEIDTFAGIPTTVTATHRVDFTLAGQSLSLLATHGSREKPMFVLRDKTSGVETYAAARFLYGENSTDKHVVLDFNKAFNPPCSFTPYALCPFPPGQNVLPVRIEAGELLPPGHP